MSDEAAAFFERLDDHRYAPTVSTRGPWDAGSQHAGPPAALLGHAVQLRPGARPDFRPVRLTFEILRPVPIRPLEVAIRVLRAGRSVELVEASLVPEGGREVMRATVLQLKTVPESVPEVARAPRVPGPEHAHREPFFAVPWDEGYHTATEWRFVEGAFRAYGPATAWMRMRVPLVAGEETTALSRVLVAADSGNGISSELDYDRYLFVNADLTVNLHRHPVGEWVCLDARTSVDPAGIGLAEAGLHDEKGPVGRSVQSLYVAPRG